MEKVILRSLSHPFEGEMLKDMLKTAGIDAWVSDANGPQKIENYLGEKGGETYLYVYQGDLEAAESFLSAEIQTPDEIDLVPPVVFPYWIIVGFALMLLFFVGVEKFLS